MLTTEQSDSAKLLLTAQAFKLRAEACLLQAQCDAIKALRIPAPRRPGEYTIVDICRAAAAGSLAGAGIAILAFLSI